MFAGCHRSLAGELLYWSLVYFLFFYRFCTPHQNSDVSPSWWKELWFLYRILFRRCCASWCDWLTRQRLTFGKHKGKTFKEALQTTLTLAFVWRELFGELSENRKSWRDGFPLSQQKMGPKGWFRRCVRENQETTHGIHGQPYCDADPSSHFSYLGQEKEVRLPTMGEYIVRCTYVYCRISFVRNIHVYANMHMYVMYICRGNWGNRSFFSETDRYKNGMNPNSNKGEDLLPHNKSSPWRPVRDPWYAIWASEQSLGERVEGCAILVVKTEQSKV